MKSKEASIIIPSYNRRDLLHFSLLSLNHQDCDMSIFEVIVIDDGSTDGTGDMLQSLKLHYDIQLLRNDKNCGAAEARNQGIHAANADIIIFSDSDCIVPPNFINGHLKHHKNNNDLALCSVINWKKVFSYYYSDFNLQQKKEFENAKANIKKFSNRLSDINFNYKNGTKILSESDIKHIEDFSYTPAWSAYFLKNTVKKFGVTLEKFQYPWVFFGTGNSSIRKKHLLDVGGFDSRILREEDWDLSYRLYKKGIKFLCAEELESFHQEHVISAALKQTTIDSYKIIFNKYTDTEMLLFCLFNDGSEDLLTLSQAVLQYKALLKHKEKYKSIVDKFDELLHYRVYAFLALQNKTKKFIDIRSEIKELYNAKHKYVAFISVFKELSRLFD